MTTVDLWTGYEARALRTALRLTISGFAGHLGVGTRTVDRWEARGRSIVPTVDMQAAMDTSLANASEAAIARFAELAAGSTVQIPTSTEGIETTLDVPLSTIGDEGDALELMRRVAASAVGGETLSRLEAAVDDLASAYSLMTPHELMPRVRRHLSYVSGLMDEKMTLRQHRRLIVVGGWLSLLVATLHVDMRQHHAANAWLRTAAALARDVDHPEIRAWCHETEAWRVLTEGQYRKAVDSSRAAQSLAPRDSSVFIQSIAQEGRAWARLGDWQETLAAIDRVNALVSHLKSPDRPEHHYRYDPDKAVAYTATTLAWLGDPAAEPYAREVIGRFRSVSDSAVDRWPRRVVAANLDLALTLLRTDRLDEACHAAEGAVLSGRVPPSNHWRALEVVRAVEAKRLPEAGDLRQAYEDMRGPQPENP